MRHLLVATIFLCFSTQSFSQTAQDNQELGNGTKQTAKEAKTASKQSEVPTTAQSGFRWRFALGASLDLGATAESDLSIRDISSGQVLNGKAEFDLQNSLAVELDARYLPANSWGFIGGLSVGAKREIESGKITIAGSTTVVNDSGDPDKLQISILSASAAYRWNQIYLPFGLNYSSIDYDSTSLTINAKGGIGAQLGIGFLPNDQFAIEAFSKVVAFDIDYVDSGLAVNFTDGFVTSLTIAGKFLF